MRGKYSGHGRDENYIRLDTFRREDLISHQVFTGCAIHVPTTSLSCHFNDTAHYLTQQTRYGLGTAPTIGQQMPSILDPPNETRHRGAKAPLHRLTSPRSSGGSAQGRPKPPPPAVNVCPQTFTGCTSKEKLSLNHLETL